MASYNPADEVLSDFIVFELQICCTSERYWQFYWSTTTADCRLGRHEQSTISLSSTSRRLSRISRLICVGPADERSSRCFNILRSQKMRRKDFNARPLLALALDFLPTRRATNVSASSEKTMKWISQSKLSLCRSPISVTSFWRRSGIKDEFFHGFCLVFWRSLVQRKWKRAVLRQFCFFAEKERENLTESELQHDQLLCLLKQDWSHPIILHECAN